MLFIYLFLCEGRTFLPIKDRFLGIIIFLHLCQKVNKYFNDKECEVKE